MKIKVAQYISAYLVQHGITDTFLVTGGGAMHLNDAFGHQEGMHCIYNHHEQGCAIAAEAYARYSGKIAAVCVTSGPGGTNAITGVMGGYLDSIPMFVVSGQVKRETTKYSCPELDLRQLGDQEFDIVGSVSNMTKYAVVVDQPEEIAYHLEKALYLAMEGRKGPVWLDIPLDVQGAMIENEGLKHFEAEKEEPSFSEISLDTVQTALEKIKGAKAPLVLVGTGVRLAEAEEELLRVLSKLQIPVVTAWNAGDAVAYDNPYFAGMPGTVGTRPGNFAVQNCDVLLSLGCRLNIRMIGYNHFDFAKNAYKIIVDIDEKELKKPTIKADMPVHGDVKDFLCKVLASSYEAEEKHKAWLDWCRNLLTQYPASLPEYHNATNGLLNPYVFLDSLFQEAEEKDRIICGNGSACVITFQAAKVKQGQRMFTNSGCAAMGYGLPAALGVAVCDNSYRTICVDGDGSIMMNLQELATIVYNQLNVKIFIINNNGYHSIRQTQTNLFKPPFIGIDGESGICFPDFGILAKAFGMEYVKIEKEENCGKQIQSVLSVNGPCICEVVVDPAQNFAPKSSSKVLPDGRIVSPSLDDMAPFLDREIYEKIRYTSS